MNFRAAVRQTRSGLLVVIGTGYEFVGPHIAVGICRILGIGGQCSARRASGTAPTHRPEAAN